MPYSNVKISAFLLALAICVGGSRLPAQAGTTILPESPQKMWTADAQRLFAMSESPEAARSTSKMDFLDAARPVSEAALSLKWDASVSPHTGPTTWLDEHIRRNGKPTKDQLGSVIIPVDSWMYPSLLRLYSMGFLDTAFLSLRPWTRRSVLHSLEETEANVRMSDNSEAKDLLAKLEDELSTEPRTDATAKRGLVYGVQSGYAGIREVSGQTLRDSWHLGQTFINDYGRPYSTGLNTYDGISTVVEDGPFSLYVRGEYQHAPSYQGYSTAVATVLSKIDTIPYSGYNNPQTTIPAGILPSQNNFRLLEATFAAHLLGHEFSIGKSDSWLGPGIGGSMAWSNNAEYMYAFHFDRIEPFYIPFLSRLLGPVRYDFFVGSLKGHTAPNSPWADSAAVSFSPTRDFQFTFQRSILFGGEGHAPVTLHTFLHGFFDVGDTSGAEKVSRDDPGARFSSTTFSWRLPYVRNWLTLYADSTTHDDVFPISAPRRAGWRPGIYLSHVPGAPKFDVRIEGVYTDYPTLRSISGYGNYFESIQTQGYTNKGFVMGDWVGREGKGLQAWLGYHLSGDETITLQYWNKKNAKDFIPGGTTQNTVRVDLVKRLNRAVELSAYIQYESWKAPIFLPGQQSDTTGSFQLTWYPRLRSARGPF